MSRRAGSPVEVPSGKVFEREGMVHHNSSVSLRIPLCGTGHERMAWTPGRTSGDLTPMCVYPFLGRLSWDTEDSGPADKKLAPDNPTLGVPVNEMPGADHRRGATWEAGAGLVATGPAKPTMAGAAL